ncbi:MAG: hypothetical protein AUJ71_00270 [Candidatus Omnitrophica bacterium CG1_02_49_16]|nr:MAG: hypothetical protein AUJ71_00270 [Candidatus Omnitrophica bacterium CG1_02_49_16]
MIEAKQLVMCYGSTRALNQVSFKINPNEIVGLLGPNGAGKTTLMRILTTFIYPTQGTAVVNGFDILKDPLNARKSLGYLPESPPLYTDMRVDEFIGFIGRARGLSGAYYRERKDWVVEACGISTVWKHTINELSLGFRQRVGLAQALLHDPKVVILDEPTSGLDPVQIIGIRNLIQELSKTKTILFSTHILQEASAVSHRILIINQGRLVVEGTPTELRAANVKKEELFRLTLDANKAEVEAAFLSIPSVKRIVFQEEYQGSPRFLIAAHAYTDVVKAVNEVIRARNWTLKELSRQEPSLEEVFLDTFRKSDKKEKN